MVDLQDQGLDVIAEGLDTLKNMAHDMNEVSHLLSLLLQDCNWRTHILHHNCAGVGQASPFDGWNWHQGEVLLLLS